MVQFLARTGDGQHFTLSINGEQYTYTNDKAGKRQAILDGLEAIETVAVGRDVYLPSNAALQAVAAVLYPDGIQTEEAYQLVCRMTEKACAHIGYGAEVELGPPHVPVTARGAYRKRNPPIDPQLVLDELELAGAGSYHPRREANRRSLWNKVAWEIYGKPWSGLTEAQQAPIQAQVDAIAAGAGWQRADDSVNDGVNANAADGGADFYTKPLAVNAAGARHQLVQYLQDAGGRPAPVRAILVQAQLGAYGRAFYHDGLAPELTTIVADVLQAHGYRAEPEAGEYRPAPVATPPGAAQSLTAALESLPTVDTDFGPALLLRDMLAAVMPILGIETVSDWQAEQLLENGVLGEALGRLGYRREKSWCQPYHFRPRPEDREARQVILKEIRVTRDPERRLSLADGLSVYAPAVVLDPEEDEIVYLEVVGAKQAVRANWAALVGGSRSGSGRSGRVHWFGRQRIELDGMKNHRLVQAALPCGWSDYILIHKQASLQAMNPQEPFYLLDDGSRQIPALFYAMLNKCLAIPLLEAWADYLWTKGREGKLIALLNDGMGQGYAAWRVLPAPKAWQQVVQGGLLARQIDF